MRKHFCNVLAKYAGQELTRANAVEIVNQLFPDLRYTPEKFGTGFYEGYTFQAESMTDVQTELHPLHQAHYDETETYRAGIAMMPNYENMQERERAGGLIQFTARAPGGGLVGHMRVYISPSEHTNTLIATEDTFYFTPAHRGGFTAVRLWQFVEKSVIAIGVREIYFDSKLVNKADVMARYLKYTPIATKFAKILPLLSTLKD